MVALSRVFKRVFALSLFVVFYAQPVHAEQGVISVAFDLSAAEGVLALFDSENPTREDIEALLRNPGVQATITQTRRFDSGATEEAYADSLWAVLNGEDPDDDPFSFERVRDRLDGVRGALTVLTEGRREFTDGVGAQLALYMPAGVDVDTTLHAVLGGTSDGWAPGGGHFYVALHYFRDDVPGMTSMAVHELYHVAQRSFLSVFASDSQAAPAHMLIENALIEGTATLVGNPQNYQGEGKYLGFLQDKHSRNMARIRENFALFEALYFRAANDPKVQFGQLYNLGFSGAWDSPLYFVGFHVAEGLERHLGRRALVDMLAEKTGPEIFAEYVGIYTESGDAELVKFTPTIEAMITNETSGQP